MRSCYLRGSTETVHRASCSRRWMAPCFEDTTPSTLPALLLASSTSRYNSDTDTICVHCHRVSEHRVSEKRKNKSIACSSRRTTPPPPAKQGYSPLLLLSIDGHEASLRTAGIRRSSRFPSSPENDAEPRRMLCLFPADAEFPRKRRRAGAGCLGDGRAGQSLVLLLDGCKSFSLRIVSFEPILFLKGAARERKLITHRHPGDRQVETVRRQSVGRKDPGAAYYELANLYAGLRGLIHYCY